MIVVKLHYKMGEHSLAYNDLKIGNTLHPGNPDIKRELEKLEKQNLGLQHTTAAPGEEKKNDAKKNDPVAAGTSTNSGTAGKRTKESALPRMMSQKRAPVRILR